MSRIVKVTIGVVFVLAALGVFYYFFGVKEASVPAAVGPALVQAPDFSFPDAKGGSVVLSSVEAEIRIVNFWASWSPYSRSELPALARILGDYEGRVAVLALNRDANSEDGRAFLDSLNIDDELLFAYDSGDTYYKKVSGFAMPETLFLDRDGNILLHVHAPMAEEAIRARLEELLTDG